MHACVSRQRLDGRTGASFVADPLAHTEEPRRDRATVERRVISVRPKRAETLGDGVVTNA